MSTPSASVVVPAHNEASVLSRCLERLLADAGPDELDVVVVANGCTDRTAAVARQFGVRVVETPVAGKVNALRLGDAECTAFPRVYMDADVELSTASVRALVEATGRPGVLACAPVPEWDLRDTGWVVRQVHTVHDRMIGPQRALAGVGVYVLTEAGHARVFPMPDVISDDGWVHRSFSPAERAVVPAARSIVRPARTVREHLRRRVRVRAGNRELAELGRAEPPPPLKALAALATSGAVSPVSVLCYLGVLTIDRARAAVRPAKSTGVAWATDAGSRG